MDHVRQEQVAEHSRPLRDAGAARPVDQEAVIK